MMRKRLFAVLAPLLLFVVLIEAYLRMTYPSLPSQLHQPPLAAKAVGTAAASGCNFLTPAPAHIPASGVVFLGDSITEGYGVAKTERFSDRIASQIPGEPVINLGDAGADFCRNLLNLATQFGKQPPRVVVWEVFADDLVQHIVYRQENDFFASPATESNPVLRGLAQNSYLFNVIWFQARIHYAPGRDLAAEDKQALTTRLAEVVELGRINQTIILPFLLEPAGWPTCPAFPPPGAVCEWMQQDLQKLNVMLETAGIPPLDLRGLWNGRPLMLLPHESQAKGNQWIPIHPDANGHQLLADVLLPSLRDSLQSRK